MNYVLFIISIAILGPLIGSLIGIIKKPSNRFMYNMLAFAAGVMLGVSFLEIIPESIKLSSTLTAGIGVLLGAIVMYILDKILPHVHPELCSNEQGSKLKRTSIYLLIGIFLHNFPEGMAMAVGSISHSKTSLIIAIAIGIHNIPEGICTSAPYYAATGKRLKAFLYSSSTALPTIVGFLVSYYIFKNIPMQFIGLIVAATAGIMIYISADELIPTSCCKLSDHSTIFSLIAGVVMVILSGMI